MKKILALAAMALVTAAVQAVTLIWSDTGMTISGTGAGYAKSFSEIGLEGKTQYAAVVTFTLGTENPNEWFSILNLKQNNNGDASYGFRGNGLIRNPSTEGATAGPLTVGTAYRLLIQVDNNVMTLYVNDASGTTMKQVDQITLADGISPDTLGIGTQGRNNGSTNYGNGTPGTYADIATYDGVLTAANLQYLNTVSYSAKALPEPTALALLALGVAGLALKRKVK